MYAGYLGYQTDSLVADVSAIAGSWCQVSSYGQVMMKQQESVQNNKGTTAARHGLGAAQVAMWKIWCNVSPVEYLSVESKEKHKT